MSNNTTLFYKKKILLHLLQTLNYLKMRLLNQNKCSKCVVNV